MAEAQARDYIGIFVNSAPLGCGWPNRTVLIANGQIYRNEPGQIHAEMVFLNDFLEAGGVEQEVNMYLNYSPCDACCTAIVAFLAENPGVTFHIKFAHVYYSVNIDPNQIRDGLRLRLNAHARITLRAVREEDWREIMNRILEDQHLQAWAPQPDEVLEWNMTQENILGNQDDLVQGLDNALNVILNDQQHVDAIIDIMAQNDHENWGTEVGNYLIGAGIRNLHNKVMQVMYTRGKDSLETIVNAANGQGYAFLLHVLEASQIGGDLLQLLQRRIIADFVAGKEFCYIIDEQIDGEADAAVGNEAAAAAE